MSDLVMSLMSFLETGETIDAPLRSTLSPDSFKMRLSQPEYSSFKAESEGALVGFITMRDGNYLYHLFVAEAFHRRGIARMLWQKVRAESSCACFNLRSSLYAVPVYKKLGFVEDGAPAHFANYSFQPMTWLSDSNHR